MTARWFLVIAPKDRSHDPLIYDFGPDDNIVGEEQAQRAYGALEATTFSGGATNAECVLLGADSVETLKRTHSSWWPGASDALNKIVEGIVNE